MNPIDRFQALIRHPDYRNDPRLKLGPKVDIRKFDIEELHGKNGLLTNWDEDWWIKRLEYSTFCRIWGLLYAVDPDQQQDVQAVLAALHVGDASIFTDDLRSYDASEDHYQPDSGHGQFLFITVDLERPTGEVLEVVANLIETKRKERGISTKRTKPHVIDPWDVWDKMQTRGGNALDVTRDLFKIEKLPTYDNEAKQTYDRVRRAYDKAKWMIEEGGRFRNKTSSEETEAKIRSIFLPIAKEIIALVTSNPLPDLSTIENALGKRFEEVVSSLQR